MTATATIDRSACPAPRHGRYWTYNRYRCRCPDAITELNTRRRAAYHGTLAPGHIDATGTRRRLQALAVEGWSILRLAQLTGLSERSLHYALYARNRVQAGTARAVTAVYERLAGHGGDRPGGRNIASRARRRGWHDSYAWPDETIDDPDAQPVLAEPGHVDQVAVDRALHGERIDLTGPEKVAAVRLGLARGINPHALARLLHISVQRIPHLAVDQDSLTVPQRRSVRDHHQA